VMTFRSRTSDAEVPARLITKNSAPRRAIPDNDLNGISDSLVVDDDVPIAGIRVDVDITHTYRGDLQVTLTTPSGTVIELNPQGTGGSADDLKASYDDAAVPALATLRGRSARGTWTLTVRDRARADTGRLNAWSLQLSSVEVAGGPIELSETPGTAIPDHPSTGIERTLNVREQFTVGSVEVEVDIVHAWVGDLKLTLVSPRGTEAVLQDQKGGGERVLARTFALANTPALARLAGQQALGAWKLKVRDMAARDDGKLRSWKLRVRRA
jgi:subtilisin-like proprotein convertase family protein